MLPDEDVLGKDDSTRCRSSGIRTISIKYATLERLSIIMYGTYRAKMENRPEVNGEYLAKREETGNATVNNALKQPTKETSFHGTHVAHRTDTDCTYTLRTNST